MASQSNVEANSGITHSDLWTHIFYVLHTVLSFFVWYAYFVILCALHGLNVTQPGKGSSMCPAPDHMCGPLGLCQWDGFSLHRQGVQGMEPQVTPQPPVPLPGAATSASRVPVTPVLSLLHSSLARLFSGSWGYWKKTLVDPATLIRCGHFPIWKLTCPPSGPHVWLPCSFSLEVCRPKQSVKTPCKEERIHDTSVMHMCKFVSQVSRLAQWHFSIYHSNTSSQC